ncbi:MAG: hypothetical protein LIP01_00325 [Tannerellaceae bacterium]|nr:hypothetical protein [Tannerellaceae bacterium]
MKKNKKGFFWPSYVDLMTYLFAITLVLFVLSYFLFSQKSKKIKELEDEVYKMAQIVDSLKLQEKELYRIKNLSAAIQTLDNNPYFIYDKTYQKHILNMEVHYKTREFKIPEGLMIDGVKDSIWRVGESVIRSIDEINQKFEANRDSNNTSKIKFLVFLEGQSSIDHFYKSDWENNDVLSYNRALSLREFWLRNTNSVQYNGKTFNDLPCEIIVSGSGVEGKPREPDYTDDGKPNRKKSTLPRPYRTGD